MSETFKDIKGYEGLYQVSNLGRVKSLRRWNAGERILKSIKNKNGYYRVHLLKNGNSKNFYIHRLVVGAFLENKENKPCTNHKNGIKADNRAENLEHCTIGENNKHAFDTGLNVPYWKGKKRSVEFIKKLVESRKGLIPWNKGKRQKPPTHGSLYEYDEYGCRCDKCKKCMSDYNKIKKIRRENRNKNK